MTKLSDFKRGRSIDRSGRAKTKTSGEAARVDKITTRRDGKCYIVGRHATLAVLEHHPERIREFWIARDTPLSDAQTAILRRLRIAVQYVDDDWLTYHTGYEQHQGLAISVADAAFCDERKLQELIAARGDRLTLLVLDEVQDPHNLGACMRSANAFGADAVIVPRNHACSVTPAASKAAAGAVVNTPLIMVSNLVRCLQFLRKHNIWIYGADDQGEVELDRKLFHGPIALVFGSEGKGIRRLVSQQCDGLFKIPMLGQVPCLNVSVAVGIGLYVASQR